jgi:hypothetical protein
MRTAIFFCQSVKSSLASPAFGSGRSIIAPALISSERKDSNQSRSRHVETQSAPVPDKLSRQAIVARVDDNGQSAKRCRSQ